MRYTTSKRLISHGSKPKKEAGSLRLATWELCLVMPSVRSIKSPSGGHQKLEESIMSRWEFGRPQSCQELVVKVADGTAQQASDSCLPAEF
ncbi:uncharacterized protein CLUP02_08828 [Colletotrichum lupini]|uniref:Uncharacterized protein n=1 Tax=Colletotrichum lupini TaxID=145971 RepID=A0A9Q8WGZ7_9PEZI|nr:uncharacterized protein CLUP02_08828 [Colletotrichum lupini]UQC83333.1 hypothetical protein CLUP02_08828 [Colletotrichum lupini]